jgi:adenylate kinase
MSEGAAPAGAAPAGAAQAPGRGSGSSGDQSNKNIHIEKKIAESKAQTLGIKMLTGYCTQMNKQMVKNVDAIINKLDIDNQSEIFEKVANEFFNDDLKHMYIDELKRRQKISIKKNLRGILYDHFKDDLKVEKEEEKRKEEAEAASQKGGEAAGGPPEGEGEGDDEGDDEGADEGDSGKEDEGSSPSGDDAAGMSLEILNKINDKILMDDDFTKQVKEGIIENISSGSFRTALQRGVFDKLEPKLANIIETKVKEILDNNELKDAALEVTKEQQAQYNQQNKKGGKKRSIKKSKKPKGKRTRKYKQ